MSEERSALMVTPASDLKTTADIVAAANGLRLDVLDNMVSGREMLRRIGMGEHEVVYFGGHGDDDGLDASDGRLDESLLRSALRNASLGRLQIVILNSCESISMAAMLYRAGVAPRIVGWPGDVSDAAAWFWARAFFRSLALGAAYWEAFESSVTILRTAFPTQRPPELLNGRIALLEHQVIGIQEQLDARRGLVLPIWSVSLVLVLAALVAAATVLVLVLVL